MNILLPASDDIWNYATGYALSMSRQVGQDYRITSTGLEHALESVDEADYVVLIHGTPTVEMRAFIDHSREQAPEVPLLVVDVPEDGELIARYLMDGVSSCLLAEHSIEEIGIALDEVRRAKLYLPHTVQAVLLDRFVDISNEYHQMFGNDLATGLEPLTRRERDVLQLIAEGLTNREIGERLFIETGTVKNHVHRILAKLNVPDRQSAAMYQDHAESFRRIDGD